MFLNVKFKVKKHNNGFVVSLLVDSITTATLHAE